MTNDADLPKSSFVLLTYVSSKTVVGGQARWSVKSIIIVQDRLDIGRPAAFPLKICTGEFFAIVDVSLAGSLSADLVSGRT